MSSSASPHTRLAIGFAGLIAVTAPSVVAQQAPAATGPVVHAAIAAATHRKQVPAIAWLCEEFLPSLPQWPADLDPQQPLALSLSLTGLQIRATDVTVPPGAVAVGTFSFAAATANEDNAIAWRCDHNGHERWHVPKQMQLPHTWRNLLHTLEADLVGTARTLSVPVIAGHLAGGMADGDPAAAALRLCPSLCGDATWMSTQHDGYLEVRGRSGGGLMLPAALVAIAIVDGGGELSTLSMRAFAARDGDQAEAARQLGRSDRTVDVATLRSLLRGDDPVRLTAIESLVRHRQSQELVNIIAAARADKPWATIAARDAVKRLWPIASITDRNAARAAMHQSDIPQLQELAASELVLGSSVELPTSLAGNTQPQVEIISDRARLLIVLFLASIGLFGLWLREREALLASAS